MSNAQRETGAVRKTTFTFAAVLPSSEIVPFAEFLFSSHRLPLVFKRPTRFPLYRRGQTSILLIAARPTTPQLGIRFFKKPSVSFPFV
jgi:hypothetical protein